MPTRQSFFLIALAVIALLPMPAGAQAYCALRDPVGEIYSLFPEAETYRSVVRVVDVAVRQALAERLPLELHFNEFGKHTLYLPLDDGREVGFVHARSEPGVWGLIEIVWAFDSDLRVRDFGFQRCRDPGRRALDTERFRAQLRGRSFTELRQMLDGEAGALKPGAVDVPADAEALAAVVLRSALKTIAVTEAVWHEDVSRIRLMHLARQHWPEARALHSVSTPYTPGVLAALADAGMTSTPGIDRDSLTMHTLVDRDGHQLGVIVEGRWHASPLDTRLSWLIDRSGQVRAVNARDGWPDPSVKDQFLSVVGFSGQSAESCSNAVELAALEVSLLARLGLESG